jgi:glycosyltransferase involved in cell wall biosynthesis
MSGDYFLAEVSFEAGNKVGGIWTVITSKSAYIKSTFGDNYLAVGFYNPNEAASEFLESPPPDFIKEALSDFKLEGVKIYFGNWVSANNTNIILIDSKDFESKHINEIKKMFWDNFQIDSLNSSEDYDEPLAWSYAAGAFLEALGKHLDMRMVVQAHEWLSAGAILYLKSRGTKIPTVFTVHATVLGRAYSYAGSDTLSFITTNISIDKAMPYNYGVANKHLTEKAGAFNADAFTVVSDIVKKEAEVILGKKADFVTPNGIDLMNLPDDEELDDMRDRAKDKFDQFLNSYFLPYYELNKKDIPIFFTSGRYEFYDKGFDLFIDALGKLDRMLPATNNVIALIAVPSGTVGLKNEVVVNYLTYLGIKESLDEDLKNFDQLVASDPNINNINLDKAYGKILNDSRRLMAQLRRPKPTNPPLCPFLLSYPEQNDMILNKLKENRLENSASNRVKIIFYPKYLTLGDELLNLTYNEALSISTAGFFLSKYEPFGYTPLEAAAYRAISFTTDHSGFGACCVNIFKSEGKGVVIEKLIGQKREDIVNKTAEDMLRLAMLNKDDLAKLKMAARNMAENFGWEKFLPSYLNAYESVLKRT